jgi:hypothetical protein
LYRPFASADLILVTFNRFRGLGHEAAGLRRAREIGGRRGKQEVNACGGLTGEWIVDSPRSEKKNADVAGDKSEREIGPAPSRHVSRAVRAKGSSWQST